jgi:hypothetical protein
MPRVRLPGPAYFHYPAAGRQKNKLLLRPVQGRPAVIPVTAYTQPITGVPLTGGQGQAVVSSGGTATISVGPNGLGNVWYPASATIMTTSGVNDNSTCNLYLGPAGQGITLIATFYPGGTGTAGIAVPSMTPGQYLIAEWTGANPGDHASINIVGTMDSIMPGRAA